MARHCSAAIALIAALAPGAVQATDIGVVGIFGNKVTLVIDNGAPRNVAAGTTTPEGVKVLAVDSGGATVEVAGKRQRLNFGEHVYAQAGGSDGGPQELTLIADGGGHYRSNGSINGKPVRFLVDTGATLVAMGPSDAAKAGIDYKNKGKAGLTQTANGTAVSWRVKLNAVKIGTITLNDVDGAVTSADMPEVLLGMSFLSRMETRQEGDKLTLKKRY